jgi:hypothetical protein
LVCRIEVDPAVKAPEDRQQFSTWAFEDYVATRNAGTFGPNGAAKVEPKALLHGMVPDGTLEIVIMRVTGPEGEFRAVGSGSPARQSATHAAFSRCRPAAARASRGG